MSMFESGRIWTSGKGTSEIYTTGFEKPSKKQIKHLKCEATQDFVTPLYLPTQTLKDFEVPSFLAGVSEKVWKDAAIALTCRHVEPHTDSWVNVGPDPKMQCSIFWLVSSTTGLHLQVGTVSIRMFAGDFVMFDDRIMHSVFSTTRWYAAVYQVDWRAIKENASWVSCLS